MKYIKRSEMRPGTIFGVISLRNWRGHTTVEYRGAFVVVDRLTEVEFFTGCQTAYGDVRPGVEFEVLS